MDPDIDMLSYRDECQRYRSLFHPISVDGCFHIDKMTGEQHKIAP